MVLESCGHCWGTAEMQLQTLGILVLLPGFGGDLSNIFGVCQTCQVLNTGGGVPATFGRTLDVKFRANCGKGKYLCLKLTLR